MKISYTQIEHLTWHLLINERIKNLEKEACDIYLTSFRHLQLPTNNIPTYLEMNKLINIFSNWRMVPVNKLVTASDYYKMLAQCQFPTITTIRSLSEIEFYISEKPDIVHEYLGHGPFLIHPEYSNFMQQLAKIALMFSVKEQILLARLFWFTIEFGLIQTNDGLRAYGAGIIPSQTESQYALFDPAVDRREFNLIDILRTPIVTNRLQKIYYIITSFDCLFALINTELSHALSYAKQKGSFKS